MHVAEPDLPVTEPNLSLVANEMRPLVILDAITAFDAFAVRNHTSIVASECAITFCARSYNTSIGSSSGSGSAATAATGTQYNETIPHTWLNYTIDYETQDTIVTIPAQPDLDVPELRRLVVPYNIQHGMSFYLTRLLFGSVGTQGEGDYEYFQDGNTDPELSGSTGDMMQAIYNGDYADCATPENGNICAMQNLATAMTTSIRNSQWLNSSAQMAPGTTLVPLQYIHATWYWITLPSFLWVLAVVMLVGTAVKTRRAGLWAWRLNPLALIFLGFEREVHESVQGHGMSGKGLETKAKKLRVRLKVDGHQAVMAKNE